MKSAGVSLSSAMPNNYEGITVESLTKLVGTKVEIDNTEFTCAKEDDGSSNIFCYKIANETKFVIGFDENNNPAILKIDLEDGDGQSKPYPIVGDSKIEFLLITKKLQEKFTQDSRIDCDELSDEYIDSDDSVENNNANTVAKDRSRTNINHTTSTTTPNVGINSNNNNSLQLSGSHNIATNQFNEWVKSNVNKWNLLKDATIVTNGYSVTLQVENTKNNKHKLIISGIPTDEEKQTPIVFKIKPSSGEMPGIFRKQSGLFGTGMLETFGVKHDVSLQKMIMSQSKEPQLFCNFMEALVMGHDLANNKSSSNTLSTGSSTSNSNSSRDDKLKKNMIEKSHSSLNKNKKFNNVAINLGTAEILKVSSNSSINTNINTTIAPTNNSLNKTVNTSSVIKLTPFQKYQLAKKEAVQQSSSSNVSNDANRTTDNNATTSANHIELDTGDNKAVEELNTTNQPANNTSHTSSTTSTNSKKLTPYEKYKLAEKAKKEAAQQSNNPSSSVSKSSGNKIVNTTLSQEQK